MVQNYLEGGCTFHMALKFTWQHSDEFSETYMRCRACHMCSFHWNLDTSYGLLSAQITTILNVVLYFILGLPFPFSSSAACSFKWSYFSKWMEAAVWLGGALLRNLKVDAIRFFILCILVNPAWMWNYFSFRIAIGQCNTDVLFRRLCLSFLFKEIQCCFHLIISSHYYFQRKNLTGQCYLDCDL